MAERKRVGILFNYSERWIGGTYYFINLVKSLLQLEDSLKPEIVIVTNDADSFIKIQETQYPYLSCLKAHFHYSIIERTINKVSRLLIQKDVIAKGHDDKSLPVLFGYYEQLPFYKCRRKLYWIPDLQDCHYPQYVGSETALNRKKHHIKLAYSNKEIVFSSEDAKNDFERFYEGSSGAKHVMPFAVTIPDLSGIELKTLLIKYQLPGEFFFAPNQFWPHKNHLTIIKAIEFLKRKGEEYTVVFTGNENTGDGNYAKELKEYAKREGLNKLVRFLGFIDRKEQLTLMKYSKAVIQPSLFEGWSTVIEDAKALDKFILASDIPVHHEQLNKNASFFEPQNFKQLAELIASQPPSFLPSDNYQRNILYFAECFLNIINSSASGK